MISKWEQKFMEHSSEIFEKSGNKKDPDSDLDNLYNKIGKLEMENDFLKKLKENRTMNQRREYIDRKKKISTRSQ